MLQKEKLMSYIKKFGFGTKTGIDLNGEGNGILFNLDKMGNVELATTAFGQGISVTPIQQVQAVSAIINGGTLYTPFLVKNYLEPETNTIIKSVNAQNKGTIIKKETSDLVKYALESVVAKGSGHNAYIENYRIGGKTGTAQTVENGGYSSSKYILSFIGFMPANDPEIIVYVAVENAKGVVQYGGTVAAPIARNIFLSAIDILDIKPDTEGIPKEYTWLDQKYVVVPDVVGMTIDEAKKVLDATDDGAETLFETSVSCIGATICQVGLRDSQGLLHKVIEAEREAGLKDGSLPKIHISGCMSSCGTHQIGEIGFHGSMKVIDKVAHSAFVLHINGSDLQGKEKMGEEVGIILEEDIPQFLVKLGQAVESEELDFSQWNLKHPEGIKEIAKEYIK